MTTSIAMLPPTARLALLVLNQRHRPMTVTELVEATGSTVYSLAPTLCDLVKRGLITRQRGDADRRYMLYALAAQTAEVQ